LWRTVAALFSASNTGVLVYSPSFYLSAQRQLRWFDRTGAVLGNVDNPAAGYVVNLSPDQTRVATTRFDSDGRASVWITDLKRKVGSALDSERTESSIPNGHLMVRVSRSLPTAATGVWRCFQKSLAGGVSERLQSSRCVDFHE
jgi:hypothetical protein